MRGTQSFPPAHSLPSLLPPPTRPKGKPNRLAGESARTCSSTPTTRWTGTRGGRRRSRKAKKEGKLVFLSIGYSSCHWCHVMERESFANDGGGQDPQRALRLHQGGPRGAARRRRHLHDRPATSSATRGGWPLSMFLTARRQADLRRHLLAAGGQRRSDGETVPRLQDRSCKQVIDLRQGQAQGAGRAGRQGGRADRRRAGAERRASCRSSSSTASWSTDAVEALGAVRPGPRRLRQSRTRQFTRDEVPACRRAGAPAAGRRRDQGREALAKHGRR